MFGAALAKGVASLGGTGVTTAVVTGGLVVGIAGAVGTGLATPGSSTDELPILACPGEGPELARVAAGQEMLVTARTQDGTWLRIHFPEPGRTEAWVEAAALRVDGDLSTLPVADCAAVAAATSAPVPVATLTASNPFVPPTEAPDTPEPTGDVTPPPTPVGPTPTPVAGDTTAPTVGAATLTHGQIFGVAACGPTSTVVGVTVTDAVSGVASVTLVARNTATNASRTVQMTPPLIGNVWTTTITASSVGVGTITFTIQARDGSGNQTGVLTDAAWTFTSAAPCDTTPPSAGLDAQIPSSPIASVAIPYAVSFSEPVTGLGAASFSTSGTAPGCSVGTPSGSGASYAVVVTCGGSGTLTLTLNANAVKDAAENSGPTAPVAAKPVTIDISGPVATLTPAAARTNGVSMSYTVSFDEPVAGLTASDFALSGTAAACVLGPVTGSGASYATSVSCSGDGTLVLTLKANAVADALGNAGPAAATNAATVTFDRVAPSATVTTATRTASLSPTFTVAFNEAVTGLAAADFSISATGAGCTFGKIDKGAKANEFVVTVGCKLASGVSTAQVTLTLLANSVTDLAGNVGPLQAAQAATTIDRAGPLIQNWTIQFNNGSAVAALPGPYQICISIGGVPQSGAITYAASVSDPAGIQLVELVITNPGPTEHRYAMVFNKLTGKYQLTLSYGNNTSGIQHPWLFGDHQYRIEATDALGNKTVTASGTLKLIICQATTG
jgi:hypothetical protein